MWRHSDQKHLKFLCVVLWTQDQTSIQTNNLPFSYHRADEFCTYHGLNVTEGCVNFARSSFVEPETRFPVKRALKLIESKRNSSIGEVGPCLSRSKFLCLLSHQSTSNFLFEMSRERHFISLRTVPTFVTAHTFCASRDTQVSYGWCLLVQGYFCAV